jgi:uncharacterized protein YdhG (YjbR/CyaY superfamily)
VPLRPPSHDQWLADVIRHGTLGAVEATKGTKGTFRFSEDDPVPEEVVTAIVAHRLQTIEPFRRT